MQTESVDYGETPTYTGATPTKPADEKYTYIFLNWTPLVKPITDDVVYVATYNATEIIIDNGEKDIITDIKKDEKSPDLEASNLTDEFAESTLSSEEKAEIEEAIEQGDSVDVEVYLKISDINDRVSTADKEKITALADDTDYIEYFDVSLFKEIFINRQSQGATSLHELATPLKLTIAVPESFSAVASGYVRTYEVIRLHDGKAEILPTTLNADGTITFETDKFSTYALAYTDTKKEEVKEPTTETPTTETPTTETPTTEASTPADKVTKAEKEKAELDLNLGLKVIYTGKKVTVKWGKVAGADRYEVYAAHCGPDKCKKIKTLSGSKRKFTFTKLNGRKLNPKKHVKVYVVAYRKVNGKETVLARSIMAHVVGTKNTKYTNVRKIKLYKSRYTLKVNKTAKIKAETVLVDKKKKQLSDAHAPQFRYASGNKEVATVDKKGKIKAVGKGTCYVYVYARNGCAKKVRVTVK